jgi:hypothetical protein
MAMMLYGNIDKGGEANLGTVYSCIKMSQCDPHATIKYLLIKTFLKKGKMIKPLWSTLKNTVFLYIMFI